MLEAADHIVVGAAANGEEAIVCFAKLRPDVTILDANMPVLDGLSAAELIRRFAPQARIVLASVFSNDERLARAVRLGAVAYLTKPFNTADLLDAVAQTEQLVRPPRRGRRVAAVGWDDWRAAFGLRILGPAASWIQHRREQRMTPTVRLVRDAEREGRRIIREIKLACSEDQSSALTRRVISWYGGIQLELAKQAPDGFTEIRSPGIPSGYVTETHEVVRTPITLGVLRESVNDDLARLRAIELRLTATVPRVKLPRLQRQLRDSWRHRARTRDRQGS